MTTDSNLSQPGVGSPSVPQKGIGAGPPGPPGPVGPNTGVIVSDGTTTVSGATELDFTGATVSAGTGTKANVAVSGGPGGGITSIIGAGNTTITGATVKLPREVQLNVPAAAGFTLVNQNAATLVDNTNGPLVWTVGNTASGNVSGASKAAPVGSWTYTVQADVISQDNSGSDQIHICGVTDGTKLQSICISSDQQMRIMAWNSPTSFNSAPVAKTLSKFGQPLWFRVSWNSGTTTLTYQWSPNGFTWITILTQSGGGLFLTPTAFFFGANITGNDAVTPTLISFNSLIQT